jgi:hypothetical protein
VLRRQLSLPYAEEVPRLAALIAGDAVELTGDEDRFVQAAVFHGMAAYLVAAVDQERIRLRPDPRHRVIARQATVAAADARLRRELAEILPVLERVTAAPALLLKGAAVADRFYPQARLRPFRDLDLMVPRARLNDAVRALEMSFGYHRLAEPWPGYGDRHGHHVAQARGAGGGALVVELHWRLSDDPAAHRIDHGWLLARSESLTLGPVSARVPNVESQLLLLAVHLLHEDEKRLAWINDIGLVARAAGDRHWGAAFEQAEELGLGWVLHRALDYAAVHLGLDRPRPNQAGPPPAWGPLRANERCEGWLALQVGQLSLGGWTRQDGYLRCAVRARRRMLRDRMRRVGTS